MTPFRNPGTIMAAATLAIVLLILFQVNWLRQSQKLVEEQFDQKVTMALCSAIDELGDRVEPIELDFDCTPALNQCATTNIQSNVGSDVLEDVLATTLDRYQIDLGFEFDIIPELQSQESKKVYCSPMEPVTQDNHTLRVQFLGKKAYVLQELGFMAGSSIILLLFVCGLFAVTLFRFMQQKRMNAVAIDVFNNMAHEFRTPITNISLALNRLKKQNVPISENRYLQVIQTENQRLQKQIECMLHVAKLDQGDYDFNWQQVDFRELIRAVLGAMQIRLEEKEAIVNTHFEGSDTMLVWGDRLHLSNVIRNLIDNSLKYSPNQVIIDIELSAKGAMYVLRMSDQGIGMDAQHTKMAFEPFTQKTQGKGFGLGLYYVKQIVDRHQGTIHLESVPDHGTTCIIQLPKTQDSHE